MWNDVPVREPESGWELLPENGWFALLGWAAGTANLRRAPGSDAGRTVRVTLIEHGVERNFLEPFGPEDRRDVDGSVNGYLADAGVPARPTGFDWYLRIPPAWTPGAGFADELSGRVNRRLPLAAPRPDQILESMRSVVGGVYAPGN